MRMIRSRAISDLLHSYVDRDSIPDSTYLMIHWLTDSIIGKQWQMLAVGTAIGLDTLTWAKDILTAMDLDNAEDSAFFVIHNLSINLRQDTLTWFDMDSTQKALLIGLANGGSMMRGYAETVLALLGDTSIMRTPEEFELPSAKFGEEEEQEEVPYALPGIAKGTVRVEVYPNPFSNSFNLRYALADEVQEMRVEVFDLMGRSVKAIQAHKTREGQLTIELGECLGIYVLRMTADSRQVHQQKVVCLRQ